MSVLMQLPLSQVRLR